MRLDEGDGCVDVGKSLLRQDGDAGRRHHPAGMGAVIFQPVAAGAAADHLIAIAPQCILPFAVAGAVEDDQAALADPGEAGRGVARARHDAAIAAFQGGIGAGHAHRVPFVLQPAAEVQGGQVVRDQQDAHGPLRDFMWLDEFDQGNELSAVARGQLAIGAPFLRESVQGEMAFRQDPDGGVAVRLEMGVGKTDQPESGLSQHGVKERAKFAMADFRDPRAVIPDTGLHVSDALSERVRRLNAIYVIVVNSALF